MNRLSTDRTLSAFKGQFVPLKLTTDGNPQWSGWVRQYPHEGRGIPILYVVRADGEKLYAQSGALEGADLPRMLLATLQQSGRTFNDAETLLLDASVTEAKAALEAENHAAAARSLSRLAKLGAVGDLKSFSALAIEADTIAKQLVETGQASIDEAKGKLDDPQRAFALGRMRRANSRSTRRSCSRKAASCNCERPTAN